VGCPEHKRPISSVLDQSLLLFGCEEGLQEFTESALLPIGPELDYCFVRAFPHCENDILHCRIREDLEIRAVDDFLEIPRLK
jgi:hypothetical protein